MAVTIDPITLQVINGALQTIAEEMGHVLYRMSFSSIIRESQDLGAGLFDTEFNTLCESESTPLHIGSLPGYLAGIQDTLQDGEWHEGDLVIHNHPYHGSSHSPDIAIAVPSEIPLGSSMVPDRFQQRPQAAGEKLGRYPPCRMYRPSFSPEY